MKTLNSYLQDIAVQVLEPLGYLYSRCNATEGTWGYSGIHPINNTNKMWDKWECLMVLDLSVAGSQILGDDKCTLWRLYWTTDGDIQTSWWVRDIQM